MTLQLTCSGTFDLLKRIRSCLQVVKTTGSGFYHRGSLKIVYHCVEAFAFFIRALSAKTLTLLPLQIALHGVGGINKMHLDFLIKHERLLDTLRRDVFCKPVIHQQRKKSMEIMRVMMEHCMHEAGKGAVLLLKIARATKYVTRHTSHVTRHTSHVTRHMLHVTCHTSQVTAGI